MTAGTSSAIPIVLDFTIRQGPFVLSMSARVEAHALALFGPSGAGKTTVLEVIAGLRRPQRGEIRVGDHVLFSTRERVELPVRRRRIGYVPQDLALFPHMSVRRNVLYGAPPRPEVDLARVLDILEIAHLLDRPAVTSLSGGERQRVAIARALLRQPALLLLDEPLAAVDLARRRRIVRCLQRIRDELTVPLVYVSHDAEEVAMIADWVLIVNDGRITGQGEPTETLARASREDPGPPEESGRQDRR
jgi:molybdate transport system ATP-binding protein